MYSLSYLEPVCCSMSSSNCCLLTCIQISQETGKVVWYSHLLKNFPQFVVMHRVKGFSIVNEAEVDVILLRSWIKWQLKNFFLFVFWVFFFFWPCCTTCRILVAWPGTEPEPPAVKAHSPNHWTARDCPLTDLLIYWYGSLLVIFTRAVLVV